MAQINYDGKVLEKTISNMKKLKNMLKMPRVDVVSTLPEANKGIFQLALEDFYKETVQYYSAMEALLERTCGLLESCEIFGQTDHSIGEDYKTATFHAIDVSNLFMMLGNQDAEKQ